MAPLTALLAWLKINWILVLFVGFIVAAFLFLRNKPSQISDSDELSRILYDGQPTVLEFYSNF
jgi:hypothetical protein